MFRSGIVKLSYLGAEVQIKPEGEISTSDFKHLSSLFRYTLHNNTGTELKVKNITATMTSPLFVKHASFCPYNKLGFTMTAEISSNSSTLKFSNVNNNDYATIANNESYDAFMPFLTGAGMKNSENITFAEDEKLVISAQIIVGDEEKDITLLTIDASQIAAANNGVNYFERGKRYWFDLHFDPIQ
ncbi:hypothetical protein [Bacteroides sp. 224]|uniref:hypothetical protein n=1 Tax=Bacteroides sp. 224 TaxID=2302936 RepID=UPI0013D3D674|nr:hypothetical protein [Bacteroides sp. 224]NDV64480.1 hypothetical protein [Bacteroides sp. 224]